MEKNKISHNYKNLYFYLTILIFSFLLYGNTISHDYALDDSIVIVKNEFTKKGLDGIKDILTTDSFTGFFGKQKKLVTGGRYRPLSIVTFALEHAFFGKNPHISHFINILLYAITGILLFKILTKLLKKYFDHRWYMSIPFLATIIFIAHPIHTEVVANIKGRDEILIFIGSLATLYYSLKYLERKKNKYLIFSFISFFLALLSKENAITFLAIIPLCIYFFTPFFKKDHFKTLVYCFLPIISATILFLIIRSSILGHNPEINGELMNNPFLHASPSEKYATIIYTFGIYIKLLLFPHPLTFDYYPYHIPILGWGNIRVLISFIFHIALVIIAIMQFKKRSLISFGILFYFITFSIVSNILFPIGTFMNERFIYISSLGYTLIIAYLLVHKLPNIFHKNKYAISIILSVSILLGFSFKTFTRNKAWKNDLTLFTTDVKISFNSAKSNVSAGGKLMEEGKKIRETGKKEKYFQESIAYLEKALEIHPQYIDALLLLGNAHFEYNKNYQKAIFYYSKIFEKNPKHENAHNNIDIVLQLVTDTDYKINTYLNLLKYYPERFQINYNIGLLYGKHKGNFKKSIEFLEKAVQINPGNFSAIKDLGVAYGMNKDYLNAIKTTQAAININPKDAELYINLGVSYQQTNNLKKAQEAFNKAFTLNPSLKK